MVVSVCVLRECARATVSSLFGRGCGRNVCAWRRRPAGLRAEGLSSLKVLLRKRAGLIGMRRAVASLRRLRRQTHAQQKQPYCSIWQSKSPPTHSDLPHLTCNSFKLTFCQPSLSVLSLNCSLPRKCILAEQKRKRQRIMWVSRGALPFSIGPLARISRPSA